MTIGFDSVSRRHSATAGLLLALIAAVALTGCSDSGEPVPNEPVTLSYQDWSTDWFPPMAREMLSRFYAFNPNIIVFYTPDPDDLAETMLEEMRAGTAPDVLQGCCTFFPIWAQEGHLLDLRPFIERDLDDEVLSDWDSRPVRGVGHAGRGAVRRAQVPRRPGAVLQQGPLRRSRRPVPGRHLDPGRVPRRDAPADAG